MATPLQDPVGATISSSLRRKLDLINETIDEAVEFKLTDIAEDIVRLSPVDTGAFVNSWSFKDNPSIGRRKSSAGKPRRQDNARESGKALNNLANDIRLAFDKGSTGGPRGDLEVAAGTYYFINGAPHANKVELRNGISAQIMDIHG